MMGWWMARNGRERWVLLTGAALAALLLLYGLLWLPLQRSRDALRQQVVQGSRDLAWMRQVPPAALRTVNIITEPASDESLLSKLDRSARSAGLGGSLLAVEPMTEGEVRMRFENVDFDAVMRWLDGQSAQGIRVSELSVQRAKAEGRSDVRVALAQGGSL